MTAAGADTRGKRWLWRERYTGVASRMEDGGWMVGDGGCGQKNWEAFVHDQYKAPSWPDKVLVA